MNQPTIFDKILSKQIPSNTVYEDEYVYAFYDIAPVAPVHVIIIPKNKNGLTGLSAADQNIHVDILGRLLCTAAKIGKLLNLNNGYRLVINDGPDAGQTVFHIHLHLLGGNQFTWPPGTSK